ncbi:MAG: hypothetical protein Rhims3KO_25130 [Hyphomicrobiales bacterium]
MRGYMSKSQVPVLINKGRDGKSRDMRHLLHDYIFILANTGIRHGAEAANLRWMHIHQFEEKGLKFFEMHVSGKTVPRDLICRAGVIIYSKRIQSRSPDIGRLSFEDLLKAQLGVPVFRLHDGTVTKSLHSWMLMIPAKRLQAIRLRQHPSQPHAKHAYNSRTGLQHVC